MKNSYSLLFVFIVLITGTGCQKSGSETEKPTHLKGPIVERDLTEIKEDGVLNAIAIYNSTSYFLYRGRPMGFEYELLERLAEDLELELQITVADNVNQLFDMLNRGEGDIIAYGLTITEPRKELISFTDYHYVTHQALVQRKPNNWRHLPQYKIDKHLALDVIDLLDDTVYVQKNSSYYQRLKNLEQELGGQIHIDTNLEEANTEDLIRKVVQGDMKYTVADYNIAAINKTYYPGLHIQTPVSFSQRIAWAVRKNSPKLLRKVNEWIRKMRKRDDYYVIYNKYFKNKKRYRRQVESRFFSKNGGKISRFDSLVKVYSDSLNWDWRLLSSLIYQESRFEPGARSWAGAIGLMQLMPGTASDMGASNPYNPQSNLKAGSKYLRYLWGRFGDIEDTIQRIKFVMASYNCGYGHLLDAQRLADKHGEDPKKWDNNVEDYLRKMSRSKYYGDPVVRYGFVRGEEPYRYVQDIFLRYNHYQKFIPPDTTAKSQLDLIAQN